MWTSILLSNSLWYVKYLITHIKNYSGQVIKLMVWLHSCNVYTESLFQVQKYCTSQQNNAMINLHQASLYNFRWNLSMQELKIMVKKTKKITTSSSIKRIFYPFIEAEQITCRSMNTLWLCCDCNARCFSHCHNLPKDQTTEDHTLDQRLGAQWIYQSAKSSFLLIHSSATHDTKSFPWCSINPWMSSWFKTE